jgi:hypothetical protein
MIAQGLLCGLKRVGVDDRRHGEPDPFLFRPSPTRGFRDVLLLPPDGFALIGCVA